MHAVNAVDASLLPQTQPGTLHIGCNTYCDRTQSQPSANWLLVCPDDVAETQSQLFAVLIIDKGAAPLSAAEHAFSLQEIECLPHCAGTYAKLASQVAFTWDDGARPPVTGGDPLRQYITQLEIQRPCRKAVRGLLVAACLTLACVFVGHAAPLAEGRGLLPALLYLPLPIVLWAAVRFGAKGASGAVLIVTVLTIWPALNGAGMFVGADPEKNVLDLQLFLAAISVPVLLLGASVDGARRTERVIRELARSLLAIRDDERRTIGRDLHESIAQTLVAASWKATEAQRVVPEVRGALKDLDDLLQGSIRKVRTVSYLLHPPLLDEAGLETALGHYADEYSRQHSMRR